MASSDEEEIRVAVVARLRELLPAARIVHELNVSHGSNRIDVAAITPSAVVAVEIKSKKDTLKRLAAQHLAFKECCHAVIVAAHEKHFAEHRYPGQRADSEGELRLNDPEVFSNPWDYTVWRYPRPWVKTPRSWNLTWDIREIKHGFKAQPRALRMLELLWAEELRAEAGRHGIACQTRRTRHDMIHDMTWMMTGREICEAVCRQLRARRFARADKAIEG